MDTPQEGRGSTNPEPPMRGVNAPPPPDVSIRTMGSDIRSLEEGQTNPVPERLPGPSMQPEGEPIFKPETVNQVMGGTQAGAQMPRKRGGVKVIIGLVVILALGAVGYFVVYPLLFPASVAPPAPSQPAQSSPTPTASHTSYFVAPTGSRVTLTFDPASSTNASVKSSIAALAEQGAPHGTLQELLITDPGRNQVPVRRFLPIFGAFSQDQMQSWFADDFTAFLYYDDKGAWPGYVMKLKTGVNLNDAQAGVAQIETVPLSPFYLEDPGTFSAFKGGTINGKPSRYALGTLPGAAFNYAWLNNEYLVFSASYAGAKEAVRALGF